MIRYKYILIVFYEFKKANDYKSIKTNVNKTAHTSGYALSAVKSTNMKAWRSPKDLKNTVLR